jgi:hypothetical protein
MTAAAPYNVHSQNGEDGIIAHLLDQLPELNSWCVEFGAWDGQYLSNTCNLIENRGYNAVLIEGDAQRAAALGSRYSRNSRVHPVQAFVGWNPDDSLDAILHKTPAPLDFDLLSIDIDGNDYHAWEAVNEYRPKLVVIEFNATIPTGVEFVQPRDPAVQWGSSFDAIVKLGKRKGYALIAATDWNAMFVVEELFPRFCIEDNSPRAVRPEGKFVTHVFHGYDGTLHTAGYGSMVWHPFPIRVRQLPRLLRGYRATRGFFRRNAEKVYCRLFLH